MDRHHSNFEKIGPSEKVGGKKSSEQDPKRECLDLSLSNFVCGDIIADGSDATIVAARTIRGTTARINIPDRDVILKSIPKFQVSRKVRQFLHREIEVHMRVGSHANISTLYASFEDDHGIYLVIERLYGPTLHRVIRQYVRLSERFTLQITGQILEAICFMHSHGFSHRDISAKNIMFREWPSVTSEKFHVMVIDMGHSCYRDPDADEAHRFSSEKIGTLFFTAPEVHNDLMYLPQSCDMWSIGVLMYMMLTGEYPYVAETNEEIVQVIYGAMLRMDSEHWEHISDSTKNVIRRLLRPSPFMRPDADRLKREVQAILQGTALEDPSMMEDSIAKPYRERKEYLERKRREKEGGCEQKE